MMRKIIVAAGVVAVATVHSWGAVPLASSTFDAGNDGWQVGEFWSGFAISPAVPVAAGGNPGGYVSTSDVGGWNGYVAPAAYLGNKSAAYGGHLFVDQRIVSSDGLDYPMVAISDGVLILQFRTLPPTGSWTTYDIPLKAAAGWEVANTSGAEGPDATEGQLFQVLSNLTFMTFEADWQTGADQVDMDNVFLNPGVGILPGDADTDGDVDLDDQGIWAANFTGSLTPGTGPGTLFTGDFDGDKDVDLDDQGIWAANFTGSLAPGGLAGVPEPGGTLMTGIGAVGVSACTRRRGRRHRR